METKQKVIDSVITFIVGSGTVIITYIDIVSKLVALIVGILSGVYLIWKWRYDVKREREHYNNNLFED